MSFSSINNETFIQSIRFRILDKYLLSNNNLKFIEKKEGKYYIFKTPENKLYLITDYNFKEKFTGPRIEENFNPELLIIDDIFTISNKDISLVLQYKKSIQGEYYVMETNDINVIISGLDVDCLCEYEKNKYFCK